MGGAPSRTRRITLENENTTSVIKVSDDVVQRLKGSESQPVVRNPVNSGVQWPAAAGGAPVGVPQPYFYEPSLTSLQLRQEKEAALKKNDQYWEKRVTDLQNMHGQMHQVMEDEYQKALRELGEGKKDENPCIAPPCQNTKKSVLACYKMYPKQPMRCNKEVEAFAQCVDVQRAILISNRG